MPFPTIPRARIPVLSTAQMIEVDRAMIEDYGIVLMQMMENAGRALALLARARFLGGDARGRHVTVLAGRGGNGGGALVAARRLIGWGAQVAVVTGAPEESYSGVSAHQLSILRKMGATPADRPPEGCDLILDGLIGYSLKGAPRGRAGELIAWANGQDAPILALDAPSGLDTASGTAFDPGIEARATLTLALPKAGLDHPRAGALYLADIGVPPELYARFLGLDVGPIFARGDILRVV